MLRLWIFLGFLLQIQAYNLFINKTIVRSGPTGSFFGFSVAEHVMMRTDSEGNTQSLSLLLIGAPKANTSEQTKQGIVNPGAVYRCPLDSTEPCSQVEFDLDGNEELGGKTIEDKSNQWFGVSLYSSGVKGNVVACAHRYLYKTPQANYHLYPGKCYTATQTLEYQDMRDHAPCKKLNDDDASIADSTANYKRYAVCQAGISATFSGDSDEALILGAPGVRNWAGAAFYRMRQSEAQAPLNYTSDSYLGLSVASGYFLSKTVKTVASGAPRGDSTKGKVVIFEKTPDAQTGYVFTPAVTLQGEQLSGGFGYSICAADLNGNGFSDLVVGAPYFSELRYVAYGKVYVYQNDMGIFTLHRTLQMKLKQRGYFGKAVANMGDMDLDGFEDIAIGAPYEDGVGAVYIYRGSKDGVMEKPSQKIKATDLTVTFPLSTFGYSLSGGVDMDGNGYPDLLVGAYESDAVVLLRSRPVVNILATIDISPGSIDINSKNKSITVDICLEYEEQAKKMTENIVIDYVLQADAGRVEKGLPARIHFWNSKSSMKEHKNVKIPSKSQGASKCTTHTLYLNRNANDVYPDIDFKLTYTLPGGTVTSSQRRRRDVSDTQSLNPLAMSNQNNPGYFVQSLKFKRVCDEPCVPDLKLKRKSNKTMPVGAVEYIVDVELSNYKNPAYNTKLVVILPPGVIFKYFQDIGTNDKSRGCPVKTLDTNETQAICDVANPLPKGKMRRLHVTLNTKNISTSQDFVVLKIQAESANVDSEDTIADNMLLLNISIKSEANLEITGRSSPDQDLYGGEVVGESAMIFEQQIGREVDHEYLVANLGPNGVPKVELTIEWPYEAKNGKHLLYLIDIQVSSGSCYKSPDLFNVLGLSTQPRLEKFQAQQSDESGDDNMIQLRRRRDIEDEEQEQFRQNERMKRETASSSKGSKASEVLDCRLGTARCKNITCLLDSIGPGTDNKVVIYSRLWNGTLLEDYYGERVQVVSRAFVRPAVSYVKELDVTNDNFAVSTLFNPEFPSSAIKGIKPWIIAVAVTGGVLLLALIIFGLYKAGFFRRQSFEGNMSKNDEMEMDDKKKKKGRKMKE